MQKQATTSRQAPPPVLPRLRRPLGLFVGLSTALAATVVPATTASAATDVITVTNTATCNAAGSLEDALQQANASTNPDGVKIVFDVSLSGSGGIQFTGGGCAMYSGQIGAAGGNHQSPGLLGARYLIDSQVPVTIDFTNLDDITSTTDLDYAGFYVRSDDVTLTNLANLQAGAAGVAIEGTDVTVSDFGFTDGNTIISETGVALLDGATNVTIKDSAFASQWWSSILIDGSVNPALAGTVTNVVIDNITSRGVESGYGHIDIEDNATVDGLTVTNSTFGALNAETHSSHAIYFNTALDVTGLTFSDNTVERGALAEKNVFYFENSLASTFTNTVVDSNTFTGVSRVAPLSRIIGANLGTWNGLEYTNNEATFTRGILMGGTITDALFDSNTFTETREPADAALALDQTVTDVTVSNNFFDTVWAVDAIRAQGTSENVVIEDNKIHDFYADVSRSAIAIIAPGTNNIVRNNEIIQHLDRGNGTDLPTTLANHWAVFVWAEASAASASDNVGWSILDNTIDGYGGNPNIASQAPIVHNAIGKLPVTGNTFGTETRGSQAVETESGGFWFLWNVHDVNSNNTVQTYRVQDPVFTGNQINFTAVKPDNEPGNNDAVGPVTLHVYWTADDNAEEYLGAIEDVAAGQRVSISSTHTSGMIRLQTVDANGFTSQYSAVAELAEAQAPAAPEVGEVTRETAEGTGEPAASIEIRDADGQVVTTATVAEDGTWIATGLECGTDYSAVQVVDGVDSESVPFRTDACDDSNQPSAPTVTEVTRETAKGTGEPAASIEIRDADGQVVTTATVAEDGTWIATGLECGTDYSAVQVVDGVDSESVPFRTDACDDSTQPSAPTVTEVTKDKVSGTGTPGASVTAKDKDKKVVGTTTVDTAGAWQLDASKLTCGTTYTVTQTVAGVESDPTTFTTVRCATPGLPSAGGTASASAGLLGAAALAMLALLAAGSVALARRES